MWTLLRDLLDSFLLLPPNAQNVILHSESSLLSISRNNAMNLCGMVNTNVAISSFIIVASRDETLEESSSSAASPKA